MSGQEIKDDDLDFAYHVDDEVQECSEIQDVFSSKTVQKVLTRILVVVGFLCMCCMGITCSYLALNSKYQRLENRQNKFREWVGRLSSDTEAGGRG